MGDRLVVPKRPEPPRNHGNHPATSYPADAGSGGNHPEIGDSQNRRSNWFPWDGNHPEPPQGFPQSLTRGDNCAEKRSATKREALEAESGHSYHLPQSSRTSEPVRLGTVVDELILSLAAHLRIEDDEE